MKKQYLWLAGVVGVIILAIAWRLVTDPSALPNVNPGSPVSDSFEYEPGGSQEIVNQVSLRLEKNGAKVPPSELLQACFGGQDCIPSIDDPEFESVAEADTWLPADARILILIYNGTTKLYPQLILNRHEIVNDWFPAEAAEEATAIAVTYCPLCGTGTAFERRVNGVITEFGVSGRLHNSNLVMYDRLEGSLWQQVTGEAVTGPAARRDEVLDPLFLVTLDWEVAKQRYPEAEVLARPDAGTDYTIYPYGNYETSTEVNFPVNNQDGRLHPKDWVQGILVAGQAKAYPETALEQQVSFTDQVGNTQIRFINNGGEFVFENLDTGETLVPLRSFWFAWAAFYPDTQLYQP